jgi:type IV fimbrial biogenesis protein FimT
MKKIKRLIKRIKSRGLTIVELLIVIVIIAIMALLSQPTYSRVMAKTDFRNAAEKMATQIRYAKNMAVSDRETVYTMSFNIGGNSYSVKSVDKDGAVSIKYFQVADESVRGNPKITKIIIDSAPEPNTIRFFARGIISSSGEIELKNDYGDMASIRFAVTGRVGIKYNMK